MIADTLKKKYRKTARQILGNLHAAFILTIAIVMMGCASTSAHADQGRPPALVKTMIVGAESAGTSRTFFGQISAKQTIDLGFQVGGRIVAFDAPEGTIIPAGTAIARLDRVPFEIEVERARLAVGQAERVLARYEQLSGNTVSEAQVLDAQTELRLAQVALRNAQYALVQTVLTVPFDTIVAKRNVGNFSTVAAGTPVVRLHDLSELRVDIEVPETLIQRLGENPDVTLQARIAGSDTAYPLVFRELNAETSDIGQTFRVTLGLDAPADRLLLPGASVTVDALLNDLPTGIVVPSSAIATDAAGNTSVMTVIEQAGALKTKRQQVALSVAASGDIIVRDGLTAGTEIAVGGVNALQDGAPVQRFTPNFN